MLKIMKYLRWTDWLMLIVSSGLIVLQVWLDLKMPDYMIEITGLIMMPGGAIGEILRAGGFMLLCAFFSLLSAITVGLLAALVAASFSRRLRGLVFGKVSRFSMEEMGRFSTPSLITRTTNDITQMQMTFSMGVQVIIKAPIMAVWAILKITGKSWQWTAATGVAVAVLLVLVFTMIFIAFPKFKIIQKLTDNLNAVTRENLSGIRVVRAYNAEKYQEAKFDAANTKLTRTNLFTGRVMALMSPGMTAVMSGLNLSIYWIGAIVINNTASIAGQMTLFADMVVFSAYAMQVVMAFMLMAFVFVILPRAIVSARRINEVLKTKPAIVDGVGVGNVAPDSTHSLEFRGVSFKYPEAEEFVLKNISFTAERGQTVAFIGATGSGKSTAINLVPRFYEATEGSVLVDGVDVRSYKLDELRGLIGYVSQKAVLFGGTVKGNVAFGEGGESVEDEGIFAALEVAQGADFVAKMEGGTMGAVAQGGSNLSGGQKQRLSIARAVYKKPKVYIFDDSFSALDYATDLKVRKALAKYTDNATVLVVAQRIGTIKEADKIVVLEEGRVVNIGTHSELMAKCEVYREIALSQLSEEELKNV